MGWVGVPRFVGAFGTSESGASVNYGYQGNRYAGKFSTAPNYQIRLAAARLAYARNASVCSKGRVIKENE